MFRRLAGLTVTAAAALFGQIDGITGAANRSISLTPSQAHIEVTVITDGSRTLEWVVAKLADTGFNTGHLSGIYPASQLGPSPSQARVAWQFRRPVPLADLSKMNESLERLRRNDLEIELQYRTAAITGTGGNEARESMLPEMLAEARRRAETVASAAGVRLGRILSIASTTTEAPAGYPGPLQIIISVAVRYEIQ